jgi:regulator of replication initiation timing
MVLYDEGFRVCNRRLLEEEKEKEKGEDIYCRNFKAVSRAVDS